MFVCETAAQLLLQYPDAKMTETEREAIRDPLSEALQKMLPAVSDTVNALALPIALVTAFGYWGYRIIPAAQIYHAQQREAWQRDHGYSEQNTAYSTSSDWLDSARSQEPNTQSDFDIGRRSRPSN